MNMVCRVIAVNRIGMSGPSLPSYHMMTLRKTNTLSITTRKECETIAAGGTDRMIECEGKGRLLS